MLARRLRRRSSINPALGQCLDMPPGKTKFGPNAGLILGQRHFHTFHFKYFRSVEVVDRFSET